MYGYANTQNWCVSWYNHPFFANWPKIITDEEQTLWYSGKYPYMLMCKGQAALDRNLIYKYSTNYVIRSWDTTHPEFFALDWWEERSDAYANYPNAPPYATPKCMFQKGDLLLATASGTFDWRACVGSYAQ